MNMHWCSIGSSRYGLRLFLAAVFGVAGCHSRPIPATGVPNARSCVALPQSEAPDRDTLVIAVDRPDQPQDLAAPRSLGEALMFRHLYQTLVEVDCRGQVRPGIASEWRAEDDATRWVFVLRDDAAFWDGSRTRAADVVASWQATGTFPGALTTLDHRTVVVALPFAVPDLPRVLAGRGFAVVRMNDVGGWPLGTGTFQLSADGPPLLLRPVSGQNPVLQFDELGGEDPRNLLDQERVDALMIRDREVLAYAASRDDLRLTPLEWSTTYVWLSAGPPSGPVDSTFRTVLARDVVRVDARPAVPPFWWERAPSCGMVPGGRVRQRGGRLLYPHGDAVARSLAERLVVLAGPGARAEGVPDEALAGAVSDTAVLGAVVAVPRQPGLCTPPFWGRLDAVPLIDTRIWLVTRPGVGPISLTADGLFAFEVRR